MMFTVGSQTLLHWKQDVGNCVGATPPSLQHSESSCLHKCDMDLFEEIHKFLGTF